MDILDHAMLESIYELGEELHDELIQMFEEEFEPRLEKIQKAIEEKNPQALAETAHSLKGSCGSIGALQLRKFVAEMEQLGKEGTYPGSTDCIRVLREIHERTLVAFKEYKAKL